MKATEIDWLCTDEGTKAWNQFNHLHPLCSFNEPVLRQEVLPLDTPIREDALRVVAISDTHGCPLSKMNLPKGDILVHSGDFTQKGTPWQLKEFDKELGLIADRYSKIVLIPGNHDLSLESTPENRQLLTNCSIYLLDEAVTLCGVIFYGSPWTPTFFDWAFMKPPGPEMDTMWRMIPENTDVLITHGPPLGILDLCQACDRAGCLALTNHVINRVKPKFHIFGHIHERHGVVTYGSTKFINASTCTLTYRPINPPVIFDVPIPSGHSKEELFIIAS